MHGTVERVCTLGAKTLRMYDRITYSVITGTFYVTPKVYVPSDLVRQ